MMHGRDRDNLIMIINNLSSQVPPFLRGGITPDRIGQFASVIPPEFKNYTLGELMDTMADAYRRGEIKW